MIVILQDGINIHSKQIRQRSHLLPSTAVKILLTSHSWGMDRVHGQVACLLEGLATVRAPRMYIHPRPHTYLSHRLEGQLRHSVHHPMPRLLSTIVEEGVGRLHQHTPRHLRRSTLPRLGTPQRARGIHRRRPPSRLHHPATALNLLLSVRHLHDTHLQAHPSALPPLNVSFAALRLFIGSFIVFDRLPKQVQLCSIIHAYTNLLLYLLPILACEYQSFR